MTDSTKIEKWLRDNKDLDWKRSSGDTSATKLDRRYIHRNEGYEIRDLMLTYYEECNINHNTKNYEITYNKIMNYKKGTKVEREEMISHLKNLFYKNKE